LQGHRRRQLQERKVAGESYQDLGLVFCRQDGRPLDPDVVRQTFQRLAARAGLPVIRFHDLRHTFATLSLKAGIATEVVSRILGHREPRRETRRLQPLRGWSDDQINQVPT